MISRTFCIILVVLVVCYQIQAFTAGAGNIGKAERRRGLKKTPEIFRNLCAWANSHCRSSYSENLSEVVKPINKEERPLKR